MPRIGILQGKDIRPSLPTPRPGQPGFSLTDISKKTSLEQEAHFHPGHSFLQHVSAAYVSQHPGITYIHREAG